MKTYLFKIAVVASAAAAFALSANLAFSCQSAEKTTAGILKSKQHIVELQATENGSVYTVKNLAGNVLAEQISADEVLMQFPQLQHIVQGVADDASLRGASLGQSDDIFAPKLK